MGFIDSLWRTLLYTALALVSSIALALALFFVLAQRRVIAGMPDADGLKKPDQTETWLAERDLRDPWQGGNNIVNLGGFLLSLKRRGDAAARAQVDAAMTVLFDWHDRPQEPGTGFWGVGQASHPLRALHAMAGSMHNHHLWFELGRPLPFQDKAVDFALAQPAAIHSAGIDVDLIDLLVHGHAEPQGLSNTLSTWFRWIAIAMFDDCLWPGRRAWHFRREVGICYRHRSPP